jgi:Arm DNA-binding domain
MPTVMLTARFVDSIKPTPGKRMEYFDEDVPGLALRVTENGAKSWTILYRHLRRLRRLTLGTTDVISLATARADAREHLYSAGKGADPASLKTAAKQAETIVELADLYIEKWAKPRKRSWKADDNLLRQKVLPKWRHRGIGRSRASTCAILWTAWRRPARRSWRIASRRCCRKCSPSRSTATS